MNEKMQWAKLIWEEYKYRHKLYWKSLYLWGGGAITIYIAPFLRQEVQTMGKAIFIFPVIGLAISLIGAWHLASESERLVLVGKKYDQLRGKGYLPEKMYKGIKHTWYQHVVTLSIGKSVTVLFVIGLGLFFIVDTLFLFILLNPDSWLIPLIICLVIIIFTFIGLIFEVDKKRKVYNLTLENSKK